MEPHPAHEERFTDFSDPTDPRMALTVCGRDHQGSANGARCSHQRRSDSATLPPSGEAIVDSAWPSGAH
jgi:hypothetical protein